MSWFADKNLFKIAVALYGISTVYSVFLWRKGFRQDNRVNYLIMAMAMFFHTVAMLDRGMSFSRCPVNNMYEAVAFILWTIVAAYLLLGIWQRLRFLGVFAAPLIFGAGLFALFPELDPPFRGRPEFVNSWASLHAALILLSYGSFGLGGVAAIMYLTQEHNLKFHKLRAVVSLLPSIQRLEGVVTHLLIAGLILLTAGLSLSPMLMKQTYGVYIRYDAKLVWSVLVWLIYAALLIMHWKFFQGGRRLAYGAAGTFAFVLLTFWGVNQFSHAHNPKVQEPQIQTSR